MKKIAVLLCMVLLSLELNLRRVEVKRTCLLLVHVRYFYNSMSDNYIETQ
jgi:hypothetical protein